MVGASAGRTGRKLWIGVALCLFPIAFSFSSASAHQQDNPTTRLARAARVNESPKIDGDLSEHLWNEASAISDFLQREPHEGAPATEKTEVKIIYNDKAIFFGVICYDSQPDKVIARERSRDDRLGSDDTFELILDTFHDHQSAFLFRTNPLGTQFDSWITDEGRRENREWDERWEAAAKITEFGWIAEIQIPFKSIRTSDKAEHIWGIDFRRIIRRKNEEAAWSNYRRNFNFSEVSQAGHLIGLADISSGLKLRVKPYVVSGAARIFRRGQFSTENLFDFGLEDVKYRITPSLTLDFTANPDFAQADVDEQVVNLSRFPVFFPEKREFFQENAGMFDFGSGGPRPELKLFHSRRIGLSQRREPIDIIAGIKLTGQLAGLDLGFMNIQTDDFREEPGGNFTVLRLRKKLFSRSVVGAIATNAQSEANGDHNRTFGVDANFVFFKNLHLESFVVKSQTPGIKEGDWAARPFRVFWQSDFLFANAEHMTIQRNFNAELGFVPRLDMKKSVVEIELKPRPPIRLIRQFIFNSRVRYISDQENNLETRDQDFSFETVFASGDELKIGYSRNFEFLERGFLLRGKIPVLAGSYRNEIFNVNFDAFSGRRFSGFFQFRRENGFWGGRNTALEVSPEIRLSENLSFEVEYELDMIKLPQGKLASNVINNRVNYNFNNRWLTSTTIQYDNVEDLFNINFRLNFIYRAGDDFFLVYNQTRRSGITERALILKLTYSFDF